MKTYLEKELDQALKINRERGPLGKPDNVLVIGNGCTAKTSIVKKWAEKNNINLVVITNHYPDAIFIEVDGILQKAKSKNGDAAKRYYTAIFQNLQKENSVLLLDHFNYFDVSPKQRSIYYSILKERKYIDDHGCVYDPADGFISQYYKDFDNELKEVELPNLLFTIAEISPSDSYKPLNDEENAMFETHVNVSCNKEELLDYLINQYDKRINAANQRLKTASKQEDVLLDKEEITDCENKKEIATKLLTSPKFNFETSEPSINYNIIDMKIDNSNGIVKEFLDDIDQDYSLSEQVKQMIHSVFEE